MKIKDKAFNFIGDVMDYMQQLPFRSDLQGKPFLHEKAKDAGLDWIQVTNFAGRDSNIFWIEPELDWNILDSG